MTNQKQELPPPKLKEKEPVTDHHKELLENIRKSRYLTDEEARRLEQRMLSENFSDSDAKEIIEWWFGDAYNPGVRKKREEKAKKLEEEKKKAEKLAKEKLEEPKKPLFKKATKKQIESLIELTEKQGIPIKELENYCREKLGVEKFSDMDSSQVLTAKNWVNTCLTNIYLFQRL